jgi:hypothetical protein
VDHLNKARTPYTRLTTIINSSGTGKSHMVDQLGKKIITVPMCLHAKRSNGVSFYFLINMACLQDPYRVLTVTHGLCMFDIRTLSQWDPYKF